MTQPNRNSIIIFFEFIRINVSAEYFSTCFGIFPAILRILQIFKDSNIQIFKDSNIQRFKYSKIQIFKDSNIQGFKDSKIQIFKDSKIQRFKDSKIREFHVSFSDTEEAWVN